MKKGQFSREKSVHHPIFPTVDGMKTHALSRKLVVQFESPEELLQKKSQKTKLSHTFARERLVLERL